MKYILDIDYSEEEHRVLEKNNCEVISKIELQKTDFTEKEIPRRMIKYGGQYIAEIIDTIQCHSSSSFKLVKLYN